ncbi:unnamed protein product, partial [Meganyctiphanes norvegica]
CSQEEIESITGVMLVSFHNLNEQMKLQNQFSCALWKLPASNGISSLTRLELIKNEMDTMKKTPTLVAIYWIMAVAFSIFPATITGKLFTGKGMSMATSNMIGPQQELVLWGDVVDNMVFWVPNRAPCGVGFSVLSNKGVIRAALNVDEAFIHSTIEAQKFLEDFESELYVLNDALQNQEGRKDR